LFDEKDEFELPSAKRFWRGDKLSNGEFRSNSGSFSTVRTSPSIAGVGVDRLPVDAVKDDVKDVSK
jgi:hypothetical protein